MFVWFELRGMGYFKCDDAPVVGTTKGPTVVYGSILITILVILAIIYLAKRV